jgi:DNA-binding NarL/FixJ family response regulator
MAPHFTDVDKRLADSDRRQRLGLLRSEEAVLLELLKGQSNKDIALSLNITEQTVKGHMKSLLRKTGATSRVALALHFLRLGYENNYRAEKR